MRTIGVTGAAGFIGGWVVDELRARGFDVVAFDRVGRHIDGAHPFLGDVRDAVAVTEFAAHVDAVIHLAAVLGTQETVTNPRPAAETNLLGTINVLDACHQYGLPMVNICVGNHWMRNTYSTTKKAAERLVEQYRNEAGLAAVNVRCVNAYGPRQVAAAPFGPGKVRKIMPAFICRALTGQPIEVYGDGEQVSDMVWVGDVARTLVNCVGFAERGLVPECVIEVGPTEHATVNAVAREVIDAAEAEGYDRVPIVHAPMRPGETPGSRVTANNDTLTLVGVNPDGLKSLPGGVRETVRWFIDHRGETWSA